MLLTTTQSQSQQQQQKQKAQQLTSTKSTQIQVQQQQLHQQDIQILHNNNNNNNFYYHKNKQNQHYTTQQQQLLPTKTTATTILSTPTTTAAVVAAATLLLQQTGAFVPSAVAAAKTATVSSPIRTITNLQNIINSNSCVGATDFSIAAIMARGANASSREPSERSLSPISVERYPDPDDDVDVDVVDCSDSESTSARPMRAHHHRHQIQQQLQAGHHKLQRHHHHSQQNHSNNHNLNTNIICNGVGSGSVGEVTHHANRSSSRGRSSPQSPNSATGNDEDRLSPEPAQSVPKIVGSCNCDELVPVQCHLETKELWDKFHELGTEMIITKTGRRMFPTVRVSFSGPLRQIQPPDRYAVVLDVVPMDSRRYRYAYHRSSWLVAGKADPPPPARLYSHPDCPISVDALRKQVVSFEKVKLTNNEMDKNGQIVLNSMHRYQPRIHLVRLAHGQTIPTNPKELQELDHKTYVFPETVFTAVTAYQNQLITKLKIDSNPFAKGFRDSSRLTDFDRDPMDSFLLEQHLRSPLRFFPDPLMAQLSPQEADAASLAFLEKARQHLQIFGRSPYTEMLLPQIYQRPPVLNAFNIGMWQQQWPQLTASFIASANQQAAAAQAQAAAAATAAVNACRTPPPPPPTSTIMLGVPPPPPATTPSSSGSASPDMRIRHFQRYSPYQVPSQQQQHPPLTRTPPL
ncbi:T-box protein H15-like isoform X2 [Eurosta solidaginis]|uniref:T-box protein H15-like isoform X2 n=1 Tax=Eurosta solidaginis TaxID=178769 RepID=UPI00353095D6